MKRESIYLGLRIESGIRQNDFEGCGSEEGIRDEPIKSEVRSHDISLLKEYGFKRRTIGSQSLNLKKIDRFGMRQLDRLKMLLLRNEFLIGSYPERVRKGIVHNDSGAFAQALVLLSPSLSLVM